MSIFIYHIAKTFTVVMSAVKNVLVSHYFVLLSCYLELLLLLAMLPAASSFPGKTDMLVS